MSAKGKVDSTSRDRMRTIAPWLCRTQNVTRLQLLTTDPRARLPPTLRHRSASTRLDSILSRVANPSAQSPLSALIADRF